MLKREKKMIKMLEGEKSGNKKGHTSGRQLRNIIHRFYNATDR